MKITHDPEKSRFDLTDDDGAHVGEIDYLRAGNDELYASHTGVRKEYEGNGYAAMLLDELAGYARANGKKIVPLCPYVATAFQKYPEKYADVSK